jgi:hypothetical protein
LAWRVDAARKLTLSTLRDSPTPSPVSGRIRLTSTNSSEGRMLKTGDLPWKWLSPHG